MSRYVVRWQGPEGAGRAHDPMHEGRVYVTREEAEAVARKFRATDRSREYRVEKLKEEA